MNSVAAHFDPSQQEVTQIGALPVRPVTPCHEVMEIMTSRIEKLAGHIENYKAGALSRLGAAPQQQAYEMLHSMVVAPLENLKLIISTQPLDFGEIHESQQALQAGISNYFNSNDVRSLFPRSDAAIRTLHNTTGYKVLPPLSRIAIAAKQLKSYDPAPRSAAALDL